MHLVGSIKERSFIIRPASDAAGSHKLILSLQATPPPAPPQISTAPVVVPPTPPAATLDPAPPSKAQLHGATDAPLTAKASPQVAPHLPQATQPEVKTPGPAGASPSVPGVPSPTTTAGPVAPAKPAREDQSITPAGSPAPAVLAPEQPVVPQAAVSEPGARVPTTQKGLGTTAGTAQDLSLGLGGVVSGFEGQLTKVPATSDDLGDLIKIAEAHLGEARRKLAAASFNGREAGEDVQGSLLGSALVRPSVVRFDEMLAFSSRDPPSCSALLLPHRGLLW